MTRVFRLCAEQDAHALKPGQEAALERGMHKTIKAVTEDIERFSYNTAISRLMELTNLMHTVGVSKPALDVLVQLLAPFAPFITEELWQLLGHQKSVHLSTWPQFELAKTIDDQVTIVAQVNGKIRSKFDVPIDITQAEVEEIAFKDPHVQKFLQGMEIVKSVYVPKKLFNIVAKPVADQNG